MRVKWSGHKEMTAKLAAMPAGVSALLDNELKAIGNELHGEAQRLAPINKDLTAPNRGNLRRSGYVESLPNHGVEVGFTAAYALRQHEELSYVHVDGEAKYLETPLKRNSDEYRKRIGRIVHRRLRGK